LGRQKHLKFGAISENFLTLTANISRTGYDIDKKNTNFIGSNPCCVGEKKFGKLMFTNKKVIDADVDLPKFEIRRDFGQFQNLTANISGADQHTENRY